MNLGLLFQPLKQYIFYIVLGLVVLGEAGFCATVLPAQWKAINEDRGKLDAVNVEIADLNKTLDYLSRIDRPTLDDLLGRAKAALPDEKKTSGLVSGLAKLASSSGALVRSLEFSPGLISTSSASPSSRLIQATEAIQGGGIKTLDASMALSADMNSLILFLQNLDKASQLLGVSVLKYTTNTSEGNQANIGLYIYYQPPPKSSLLWKESSPLTEQEQKTLEQLGSKDIFSLQ